MKRFGLALLLASATTFADGARPAPLTPLPRDRLIALAPLLRGRDLALIEADARGALKQTTTITLVAAPPALVRDVVIHPERYPDFVRNMKKSRVVKEPGGTILDEYLIDYRVYTVDGRDRYVLLPKGPADVAAPVDMYDPGPGAHRHYRWEFLPAGGATELVLYGYPDVPHDGFVTPYLKRASTLEYGFALIPQLTLLRSMKARAEKLSGPVALPAGKPGSLDFLLDRGALAILHCDGARLVDLALVERSSAPPSTLIEVAGDVTHWKRFIPTIDSSAPLGAQRGFEGAEIDRSLPLMQWATTWAVRQGPSSVDMYGVTGDLRGARLRWDARPLGPGRSELVLRAIADYRHGSLLLREVYKLEPFLEYGFDVAMNLLLLQSVRHRAEQLAGGAR